MTKRLSAGSFAGLVELNNSKDFLNPFGNRYFSLSVSPGQRPA